MRLITLILLSCLLSNIVLADCPNAINLNVGDVVKDCPRVGLSKQMANQLEKNDKQNAINLQIIATQKDLIQWREKKAEDAIKESALYKADDQRERTEVDRLRGEGNTKFLIGIGVGVVGSFLAAIAAAKLVGK